MKIIIKGMRRKFRGGRCFCARYHRPELRNLRSKMAAWRPLWRDRARCCGTCRPALVARSQRSIHVVRARLERVCCFRPRTLIRPVLLFFRFFYLIYNFSYLNHQYRSDHQRHRWHRRQHQRRLVGLDRHLLYAIWRTLFRRLHGCHPALFHLFWTGTFFTKYLNCAY